MNRGDIVAITATAITVVAAAVGLVVVLTLGSDGGNAVQAESEGVHLTVTIADPVNTQTVLIPSGGTCKTAQLGAKWSVTVVIKNANGTIVGSRDLSLRGGEHTPPHGDSGGKCVRHVGFQGLPKSDFYKVAVSTDLLEMPDSGIVEGIVKPQLEGTDKSVVVEREGERASARLEF